MNWLRQHRMPLSLMFEPLTTIGAVSLPLLTERGRLTLQSIARHVVYKAQPETVGKGDRLVRQQIASCPVSGTPFEELRRTFQLWLSEQLRQSNSYPFTTPVEFNEMVLQKYQPGSLGITPHRDGKKYVNLVCIFVLEGQGTFFICRDRAGSQPTAIDAPPGNVILMRASGFRGVESNQEARPFHFVSDIRSTRYTLGLRQNITSQ